MVLDFLDTKYPPYVLTEDTSVVKFKRYYKCVDGVYSPVLNMTSIVNPKTSGLYEFRSNHNAEYRDHVEALQMNGLDTLCRHTIHQLERFPVKTLERTIDGIDYASNFIDTKFEECVGTVNVPSYVVAFDVAMHIVKNMCSLMNTLATNSMTWCSAVKSFIDDLPTTVAGQTYVKSGYTFDPSTLGDNTRSDDVYTCFVYAEDIDYKKMMYILQAVTPNSTYATAWNNLVNTIIPNAFRTLVDLSLRIHAVEIVDLKSFSAKTTVAPGTVDHNGTTYYRLMFNEQLVNNKNCLLAMYDHKTNSIVYRDPELVINALAKFAQLSLSDYNDYRSTVDQEIPISMFDRRLVWYTEVPFKGV